MSDVIPVEAVEAVAIAWAGEREWREHSEAWRFDRMEDVGQILEAALPHIVSSMLEAGWQEPERPYIDAEVHVRGDAPDELF